MAVAEECAGRVHEVAMDVTSDESVQAAVAQVTAGLGGARLHALVNNAGVCLDVAWCPPPTAETVAQTLAVNYYGVKRVFAAFLPLLAPHARVVNLSSGLGPTNLKQMSEERRVMLTKPDLTLPELDALVADFTGTMTRAIEQHAQIPGLMDGWYLVAYGDQGGMNEK